MQSVDQVVAQREGQYGGFRNVARVSQALKDVVYGQTQDIWLPVQREAMDMILHKIARLACGGPHQPDTWTDLAGYAKLVPENAVMTFKRFVPPFAVQDTEDTRV